MPTHPHAHAKHKHHAKHAKRRGRRWSKQVTEHSDALDVQPGTFTGSAPEVAKSLKQSAERSTRRKASPYRSAMSMLTFFVNRAGKTLGAARKRTLERAKLELKKLFASRRAAH